MSDTARKPAPRGRRAAAKAAENNSLQVSLPLVGKVSLPPPQQLAYFGGIGVLTALQLIEWPVSVALAAGHVLATSSGDKSLRAFGEALEDA
ncbi:hypothetical protein CU254_25530 [Amycolatopsis sp. AA4]|uniref:hypothetical protein n=1 Tax=Actinomycetes TaxID=1760 RepID=UPI0001B53AE1|nr:MULTISPECIES: hypothetical protein [Actinomycetes]ATY13420.1 hypothetical protein CU254_25530 [Amycolatopsis sp. AA4]EFL09354.1 conserved hypothetical protein [Streptomyces sp. AA4]